MAKFGHPTMENKPFSTFRLRFPRVWDSSAQENMKHGDVFGGAS